MAIKLTTEQRDSLLSFLEAEEGSEEHSFISFILLLRGGATIVGYYSTQLALTCPIDELPTLIGTDDLTDLVVKWRLQNGEDSLQRSLRA